MERKSLFMYDLVYPVSGIAHADVGNISDEVKRKILQGESVLAVDVA